MYQLKINVEKEGIIYLGLKIALSYRKALHPSGSSTVKWNASLLLDKVQGTLLYGY
jgi:hypothetical protein